MCRKDKQDEGSLLLTFSLSPAFFLLMVLICVCVIYANYVENFPLSYSSATSLHLAHAHTHTHV
jgi:hypothetical protein